MIPKSLHTVTVIVQLTRHIWGEMFADKYSPWPDAKDVWLGICLDKALYILGYLDSPDVHGLKDQALKKLNKG